MIHFPALARLLSTAICAAELSAREAVLRSLRRAQEPEITTLLVVEVDRQLSKATAEGRVAATVLADLDRALCNAASGYQPHSLRRLTQGLVARVLRHGPADEKRSGADIGFLVVQPHIEFRWGHLHLERRGQKRGILAQSKRRLFRGRWNQLTENQRAVLPGRMAYAALLRYEFEDLKNTKLKAFRWNLLADADVSDVSQWLCSGEFPADLDTGELVSGLCSGCWGTDDGQLIEQDICPMDGKYMVVEVDWRDGEDPESHLRRLNRELLEVRSQHTQLLRLRR